MLGGDGATEGEHGMERLLDRKVHSRQLVGVAGDEVLMRMTVPGVAINDGYRSAMLGDGIGGVLESDGEPLVRHRPVGGNLATAKGTPRRARFIHRRRYCMAQSSRLAKRGPGVGDANVIAQAVMHLDEREPVVE